LLPAFGEPNNGGLAMMHQPDLSDRDWDLLLELLENERRELPPEIRHTDTPGIHDGLLDRLAVIDGLIDRIHVAQAAQM
jgi:hypothetical protein